MDDHTTEKYAAILDQIDEITRVLERTVEEDGPQARLGRRLLVASLRQRLAELRSLNRDGPGI